jgi:acid phosphatase (class A)
MSSKKFWIALLTVSFSAALTAQQMGSPAETGAAPKAPRVAYYIDSTVLNANVLLSAPPAAGSATAQADLAEVHRAEQVRTPAQAITAKADEDEENIFAFKTVFGPGFNAQALPVTAALGAHVKNEEGVVAGQLKALFERPRPYQIDSSLHPVCKVETTHDSYPSGHAFVGYLSAFTLAEIAPEKKDAILARADEYAHNRVVCGVHYPSDVEASRRASYVVFGYMMATPRFQKDLAEAREEMRKAGLLGK